MSTRAVLIALAVLVLLGAATFVAMRQPPRGTTAVSGPLMELPASNVGRVTVEGAGWKRAFVRRADGGWGIGQDGGEWFAESERVEAFVKLVAQSRSTPVEGTLAGGAVTLELGTASGAVWKASLDDRDLGGTVLARVNDGSGGPERMMRVPADLVRLMSEASVRTWVSRAAFPLGVTDAGRIKIEQSEYSVTLQRQGQRWAITAPVALPADQEEIAKLIAGLGRLGFAELREGDGSQDTTGRRIRFEVGSEVRGLVGDEVVRTERAQTLTVGAAESPGSLQLSAQSRVASLNEPERQMRGVLDAAAIDGFSADPAAYASRSALSLARADIRRIEIRAGAAGHARVYALSVDGWETPADAPPLRTAELIDWLVDEKAERVVLGAPAATDLGVIRAGPDEAASQTLSVGVVPAEAFAGMHLTPGTKVVVVRAGARTLVYTSAKAARAVGAVFGEDSLK